MNDIPIIKLTALTKHFGKNLLNDSARCDDLLTDYCGEYRLEVSLLISALREGSAKELLSAATNGVIANEVLFRMVSQLQIYAGILPDYAEWAVKAIVAALELQTGAPIIAMPPESRLTYTDSQTGLMWTRNGDIACKKMKYKEAADWVNTLNYGGYFGWRLPSKEELEFFAKKGGVRPSEWFNTNGFENVLPNFYWTTSTDSTSSAWVVSMSYGFADYYFRKDYLHVWPVRDGQGHLKQQLDTVQTLHVESPMCGINIVNEINDQSEIDLPTVAEPSKVIHSFAIPRPPTEEPVTMQPLPVEAGVHLDIEIVQAANLHSETESKGPEILPVSSSIRLLTEWLEKQPSVKWNNITWNDFIASLTSPVDKKELETFRDSAIVNYDEYSVKDLKTGLIWHKNVNLIERLSNPNSVHGIIDKFRKNSLSGYATWRLPIDSELAIFNKRATPIGLPEYHKLCLVRRIDKIEIIEKEHTFVDVVEGVEWLKYNSSMFLNLSFAEAIKSVNEMSKKAYLGHSDWRLPTRDEFAILIEYYACESISGLNNFEYWTSSNSVSKYYYVASVAAPLFKSNSIPSNIEVSFLACDEACLNRVWPVRNLSVQADNRPTAETERVSWPLQNMLTNDYDVPTVVTNKNTKTATLSVSCEQVEGSLDMSQIRLKQRETEEVSALLRDIFTNEDDAPSIAPVSDNDESLKLDDIHAAFLCVLTTKEVWRRDELEKLASGKRLLLEGVLQTINEEVYETYGEPLFEDDDPIELNMNVVRQIMARQT
jgi:hypothetical protein